MAEKMLITADQVNPIEIFVNGKYGDLLEFVKKSSEIENPDVTTQKGRNLIKSMAAKVASSKVFVVGKGKELADKEKKKIADTLEKMNTSKKFIDDCLVYRKAEVREPLTKWEAEKKAKEDAEKLLLEIEEDRASAIEHNQFLIDKKTVDDEAKRLEKENVQLEADKKAIKNAGSFNSELVNAAVKNQGAAEAEVERLKQKGIEDAKNAEIDRENAVRLAEQKAADESKKIEDDRIEKERLELEEAEKIANDVAHQKAINNEALPGLVKILDEFISESETAAKKVLVGIIMKRIKHVSINY